MLPKLNRLPSPDIKSVMQRGRRVNGDGVQFAYRRSEVHSALLASPSRFAFVVPISVDKRAVVRNRMRRLVRESVRHALPSMPPGWDGVFFVRKKLPDELVNVDEIIRLLLQTAGLL